PASRRKPPVVLGLGEVRGVPSTRGFVGGSAHQHRLSEPPAACWPVSPALPHSGGKTSLRPLCRAKYPRPSVLGLQTRVHSCKVGGHRRLGPCYRAKGSRRAWPSLG